jgi:hypothetical protein
MDHAEPPRRIADEQKIAHEPPISRFASGRLHTGGHVNLVVTLFHSAIARRTTH